MNRKGLSEAAFETVIEALLLHNEYLAVARDGFDRERGISELQTDVETSA